MNALLVFPAKEVVSVISAYAVRPCSSNTVVTDVKPSLLVHTHSHEQTGEDNKIIGRKNI